MDYLKDNTESRKQKHLNFEERMTIQIRLSDGYSPYRIAKELGRAKNTILNEIRRGTTSQIKVNKKVVLYLADTGYAVYKKNRSFCCPKYKRLLCDKFIRYVCQKIKVNNWSIDACVGNSKLQELFPITSMVCTKTIYNYIDLGLMEIKNIDLPMKLRHSTKPARILKNRRKLGTSISQRPESIEQRTEFGHWEIDTVIGHKTKDDSVLLTIAERMTRNFIIRRIDSKNAKSVTKELYTLQKEFGNQFSQVFKSITSDNGLEFSDLHKLEANTDTKVYFTHPYSSYERGTNERHNGLIRRFIPKYSAINGYTLDEIALVEEWCNTLPRKILDYQTPESLYEQHLDIIYSA